MSRIAQIAIVWALALAVLSCFPSAPASTYSPGEIPAIYMEELP